MLMQTLMMLTTTTLLQHPLLHNKAIKKAKYTYFFQFIVKR
jgi:hypothetical protein